MFYKSVFLVLIAVILSIHSNRASAFVIDTYGPSAYDSDTATMNATLGLTSSETVFEDFEDASLITGLTLDFSGISSTFSTIGGSVGAEDPWDGDSVLELYTDATGQSRMTFLIAGGTNLFGFGISDNDARAWTVIVNDGEYVTTSLPGLDQGSGGRNGYVTIRQEIGDSLISKVDFLTDNAGNQSILFDHVAVGESVPTPASVFLLLIGLVAMALNRTQKV